MPRLKKSSGKIEIQVTIHDEFQRWLMYEIDNSKEWNQDIFIDGGMTNIGEWRYKTKWWDILYRKNKLVVISDEPIVHIRKGLVINMGHGRIEIS